MFKYISAIAAVAVLIVATEASSLAGPFRCRGGRSYAYDYGYSTAAALDGYRSFSYEPGMTYPATGSATSRRPSYMDAGSKARGDFGR